MTQEFKQSYDEWVKYLEQLGYRKVVLCKDCTKYKHWECPIEQSLDTDQKKMVIVSMRKGNPNERIYCQSRPFD